MSTNYTVGVHVREDTKMGCLALNEERCPSRQLVRIDSLTIFIDTPDLERLHGVIAARLAELAQQVAA